jgi:nitrogen fixation NifU-like protein
MVQQGFSELMQSRGTMMPDEDLLGDGIAFAGVSKYPARVKCALLAWMAWRDAVSQAVDSVVEGKTGE